MPPILCKTGCRPRLRKVRKKKAARVLDSPSKVNLKTCYTIQTRLSISIFKEDINMVIVTIGCHWSFIALILLQ